MPSDDEVRQSHFPRTKFHVFLRSSVTQLVIARGTGEGLPPPTTTKSVPRTSADEELVGFIVRLKIDSTQPRMAEDEPIDPNLEDEEEDEEEDPLADLPPCVIERVEVLRSLEAMRGQHVQAYLAERAALELKYAKIYQPQYEERAAIVKGEKDSEIGGTEAKGIPHFWLTCMSRVESVSEMIQPEDVACLEHLIDVTCVDDEDGTGFTLRFEFSPNDFFHDTVLTKRYDVPNLLLSDEPMLKNVVGCAIQWKGDQCLTSKKVVKKQRGKGKNAGQVRSVTKTERTDSFFHWFGTPEMPTSMDDLDEDEAEQLEESFGNDYEIALEFRKHLIPNAVSWFTGEVGLGTCRR